MYVYVRAYTPTNVCLRDKEIYKYVTLQTAHIEYCYMRGKEEREEEWEAEGEVFYYATLIYV